MSQRRIVLSNSYGTANIGDEAILTVLVDELTSRDFEVDILTFTPADTATKHPEASALLSGVLRGLPATLGAIRRADLLVVGGGGILQDGTSLGNLLFHVSRPALATASSTPFVIAGVGVGPLQQRLSRQLVRWACNAAEHVSVRDNHSLGLLNEIGASTAGVDVDADLAHLLTPHNRDEMERRPRDLLDAIREHRRAGRRLVGLSLRPAVGSAARRSRTTRGDTMYLDKVARLADACIDRIDAHVVFVSMHPEQDDKIAGLLAGRMNRTEHLTIVPGCLPPRTIKGLVANLDLMIGTRLHALIFALGSGVPSLALAYDAKVSAFLESVGMGELVIPGQDWSVEAALSLAARALDEGPALVATIGQTLPRQVLAARNCVEKICAIARGDC